MKTKTSYKKGHIGYWKGKINLKKRRGEHRFCLICNSVFYVQNNQIKKGWGKYCSNKCKQKRIISMENREKMSQWQKGEKNKHWRGGVRAEYRERFDYKWNLIKKHIYLRDNYTCQKCMQKCTYRNIQCHHVIPYRRVNGDKNKILFWNVTINSPGNLVTLCSSCHIKEDRKIRSLEQKGNYGIQTIYHLLT